MGHWCGFGTWIRHPLHGVDGLWWVVMGTGGRKVRNGFAVSYPVSSLGTFCDYPLPRPPRSCHGHHQAVPIPMRSHMAGPWAQPHSGCLSLGTATQQDPIPRRSHAAGPHLQARPCSRSPSGLWPSPGLLLQQTMPWVREPVGSTTRCSPRIPQAMPALAAPLGWPGKRSSWR